MSTFEVIELIQKANNTTALAYIEEWINESHDSRCAMLADMVLIKKCELLTAQYTKE